MKSDIHFMAKDVDTKCIFTTKIRRFLKYPLVFLEVSNFKCYFANNFVPFLT